MDEEFLLCLLFILQTSFVFLLFAVFFVCVCVCVFGGRWLEFLFNHYSKGFLGMIGLIFYASEKLDLAVRRCGFYAYQW